MTIPPNIQKQIEEVAKAAIACLREEQDLKPSFDDDVLTLIPFLTEITQPLMERIEKLEQAQHEAYYGKYGKLELSQKLIKVQAKVKQMKEVGDILDRRLEVWRGCTCGKCISCKAITNWREVTKEL